MIENKATRDIPIVNKHLFKEEKLTWFAVVMVHFTKHTLVAAATLTSEAALFIDALSTIPAQVRCFALVHILLAMPAGEAEPAATCKLSTK